MKFDLGSGHLGNGITVWNRAKEEHGDYQKIAHIGPDRKISWYIKNPPKEVVEYVQQCAKEDPRVSQTQDQKVFHTKAGAMNLKNMKIGETSKVNADSYEQGIEANRQKVAKEFPALWKGICADHNYGAKIALQDLTEITSPNGKVKIFYVEDPGHGWYFDEHGKYLGEEDGGLDESIPEAKKIAQELANWSLSGKGCSQKTII
jgi:hypothetical protein